MTVMRNAKEWFIKHPKCKVIYHRRWKELSAASRERLETPRTVVIHGHRASFSDGSELPLFGDDTSNVSEGGLLDIYSVDGQIIVTYASVD